MITDALTTFSTTTPALTGISGGATGYSDTIDGGFGTAGSVDPTTNRNAGQKWSVQFTTLPTSGTGGATLNVALQTSSDNGTWVTLLETGAQPIANYTATNRFIFRGSVPSGSRRYLRLAYTPSATLTAGAVQAQLGGEFGLTHAFPRNFIA